MKRLAGGCLCWSIRYSAEGPFRPVIACHCGQCRRTSGHYSAATMVGRDRLSIDGKPTWFESSPGVRRGFCDRCGSSLFWQGRDQTRISIFAGTLDDPTGLVLGGHIHLAHKGDYYTVGDDLPCAAGTDTVLLEGSRP